MATRAKTLSGDSVDTSGPGQDDRARAGSLSTGPRASSTSAHPVDRGWAWAVMIGVFGVHFLTFGYIRSFGILFVEFQTKFQATSAMTAVVNGAQFCTYSLSTFLAMNVITKYFSIRQCCLLGCFLEALGILLNGVVSDIKYLIFTQGILFGSGLAFLYCPALIILSHYFNEKRAIATSIATSGVSAGGITLPPLMRYLLDSYGLRGGLMLLSGVMFHQALCVFLFTPTSKYSFVSAETALSPNDANDERINEPSLNGQDNAAESQPFITRDDNVRPDKVKTAQSTKIPSPGYDTPLREHEDASRLLQQVSDGAYLSHQQDELRKKTTSLANENHKLEKRNVVLEDHEEKDLAGSIATSVLSWHSNESSLDYSSSQADTLCDDFQNKLRLGSHIHQMCKAESAKNNDKDMFSPSERFVAGDKITFVQILPRKPSLKATILEALSTSSLDLRCNIHNLTSQDQGESSQRNEDAHEGTELKGTRRRRCRLPPVAKTLTFWVMLIFFACGWVASALPTIFIPPLAKEKGLNDHAALLLMASALAELAGRLGPGIILQFGFLRPHSVLIVPLAACATLYQFTGLFNNLATLVTMSVLSGLFTGVFWSMQSLVVIEVFGLDKLGQMLGFYFLIAGFSVGASNPIGGLLRDISGTYASTFHFFGSMYYVAASMMVIVVFIKKNTGKSLLVTRDSEHHQSESGEQLKQDDNPHVTDVVGVNCHSTSVLDDDRSHATGVVNDKCETSKSVNVNSHTRININL